MYFEMQMQVFFLIFARITALLLSMPFLSARSIPPLARGGLIFFISLALMPMVRSYSVGLSSTASAYLAQLLAEISVGLLMGLLVQAIFGIFRTAGELFSIQMAFSASYVFDPMGESNQPLLAQFMDSVAILLFLSAGPLHTFVLVVLAQSFTVLPEAAKLLAEREGLLDVVIYAGSFLLKQAFFIALPMVASILMVSVTLGLMAKAAPQMNLLVLGFPIQTSIGFLVLFLSMPFLLEQITVLLETGLHDVQKVLSRSALSLP